MKAKSVFVTGASGFLGKALIRRLVDDDSSFLAVSRSGGRSLNDLWTKIERYEDVAQRMLGRSCVIHLAARVHVMHDASGDPLSAFRAANVCVTESLARQAAAAGVRRFIFISSVKVNGEETLPERPFKADDVSAPQDAYGISKKEAEERLRVVAAETGLEIVIIRPPLVYGPGVRANFRALMQVVGRGFPLPLGAIRNKRSLVGLENLVDLIVTCIDHPGAANQTFLVSDGNDLSTPELVRRMATAMNKQACLVSVPVWVLRIGATMLGKRAALQRLCSNLQVDISKTTNVLGWKPPVTVDEGLRRAMAELNQ